MLSVCCMPERRNLPKFLCVQHGFPSGSNFVKFLWFALQTRNFTIVFYSILGAGPTIFPGKAKQSYDRENLFCTKEPSNTRSTAKTHTMIQCLDRHLCILKNERNTKRVNYVTTTYSIVSIKRPILLNVLV